MNCEYQNDLDFTEYPNKKISYFHRACQNHWTMSSAAMDTSTPVELASQPGGQGADDPSQAATPGSVVRTGTKRQLSERSPEAPDLMAIESSAIFPTDPPEGVHPTMWEMLRRIQRDVSKIHDVQSRVTAVEDIIDHDSTDISLLKHEVQKLIASNKTLSGRLLRAEVVIKRQQDEITDLKSRSMRDNIIIKTAGDKYKETKNENTNATVRKFLQEELRIPDAQNIIINSSHRMGVAWGSYNRMLIARLPRRIDHEKVFDNVKVLRGTQYSIVKQVPPETDERRQFAWTEFKKAKEEKRPTRFDGSTLVVGGQAVRKFDPLDLPNGSNVLQGRQSPASVTGTSDLLVEGTHTFRAWATQACSVYDVREAYDHLLHQPELAGALHAPYAFRFNGTGAKITENFYSDGDTHTGVMMVRVLRELSADNIAVFVAHNTTDNCPSPLPRRKKMESLANVIAGAMMALTAAGKS